MENYMTTKTNEMDDSYASGGYASMPPDGQTIELPMTTDVSSSDDYIAMGDPSTPKEMDPESVYVYANSINPVSSVGTNITAFDVVFSVSCTCPDTGTTSTYQVVKRIGVDKMKMASAARSSTPVSIVESKKPEQFNYSASRLKALAGLK
jgi:hypothetical protein